MIVRIRLNPRTLNPIKNDMHSKKIERIEVHNNDKYDGHCHVKVDIYFTAAGMITLPTEKELEKLMDEIRQKPQQYRVTA